MTMMRYSPQLRVNLDAHANLSQRSLLQEALEIHVISTILERSLILDPESLAKVEAYLGEKYPPRTASRCAQRQIKLAFLMVQRQRTVRVLESWGKMMRKTSDSNTKWAPAFCVFIVLILIMDKTIASAYLMCRNNIENRGHNQRTETGMVQELVGLMETQLFERCKEIFHSRYKTRKGANDRCNPFRDGVAAWRNQHVDTKTTRLVDELQRLKRDFGMWISSHLPPRIPASFMRAFLPACSCCGLIEAASAP